MRIEGTVAVEQSPDVARDDRGRAATHADLPRTLAGCTIRSAAGARRAARLEEIEVGRRVASVVPTELRIATLRASRDEIAAVTRVDAG